MRSLTVKKNRRKYADKRSRKASTNTDIFTLFPVCDSNPYDDVIFGPQGKRVSHTTVRRDGGKTGQVSPSKSNTAVSASRAQVQMYIETCERLEEELEALKASHNVNIQKLKEKNILLMEESYDLKQKLTNSELLVENFKLKKYGEGEDDYEFIWKQNEELK